VIHTGREVEASESLNEPPLLGNRRGQAHPRSSP
jgi:hypothetical protein